MRSAARAGTTLPFALDVDGKFPARSLSEACTWSSLRGAHIGYWLDRDVAGSGVMPLAVAMASRSLFPGGLHASRSTSGREPAEHPGGREAGLPL